MPKKYALFFKASVEKDLRKIATDDVLRIKHKLETELVYDPQKKGIPLKGQFKGFYKYRVNRYRIIYRISHSEVLIIIIKIAHRKDVYR